MSKRLCVNCMKGFLDENRKCDTCGVVESDIQTSQRHLPPRTILRGKYLVGKVIGEGGFGITYLGYDLDLDICVAIKEFCPRDYAGREMTNGLTITPFDSDSARFFELEKSKFINEAKRLAKFRGEQGIVSVQDYFQENETAYIVMEYIEGITLKKYLQAQEQLLTVETVLSLMKPVMQSLGKMHAVGIIHRDISPDNIMISNDGKKVYLIDFGTAREAAEEGERSLSVYKKSGYTPIEQQSTTGNQGAWTDVYAMCATIYRCITSRAIPEATERLLGEEVIKPSELGVAIDFKVEQALLHGLAVKPDERTRNMEQLIRELTDASAEKSLELQQPKEENKPEKVESKEKKVEEEVVSVKETSSQLSVDTKAKEALEHKNELKEFADITLKKTKAKILLVIMLMYGISTILSADYRAFRQALGGEPTLSFCIAMWCIPVVIELILILQKKIYSGIIVSVIWFIFWTWHNNEYFVAGGYRNKYSLDDEYSTLNLLLFIVGWVIIHCIWNRCIKNVHQKIMPITPTNAEALLLIENMSDNKYPITFKQYNEYYYKKINNAPDILEDIKEQWKKDILKQNAREKRGRILKIVLVLLMGIGVIIASNAVYRVNSDNGTYYKLDYEWGRLSDISSYNSDDERIARTYYSLPSDNIYSGNLVSTSCNDPDDYYNTGDWMNFTLTGGLSVHYVDGRLVYINPGRGGEWTKFVDYKSPTDFTIEWWKREYPEDYEYGSGDYDEVIIGTIEVKNGKCENFVLNEDSPYKGYVEYSELNGIVVTWKDSRGDVTNRYRIKNDTSVMVTNYSPNGKYMVEYSFTGEDDYRVELYEGEYDAEWDSICWNSVEHHRFNNGRIQN